MATGDPVEENGGDPRSEGFSTAAETVVTIEKQANKYLIL
jgi:hypothetical protein